MQPGFVCPPLLFRPACGQFSLLLWFALAMSFLSFVSLVGSFSLRLAFGALAAAREQATLLVCGIGALTFRAARCCHPSSMGTADHRVGA